MTSYSGRTTAYAHKHPGWEERDGNEKDCIRTVTLFDVQWSNCPTEVEDEVRKLWGDNGFGNGCFYYNWGYGDQDDVEYPVIHEYLTSRGITECLIHWWW